MNIELADQIVAELSDPLFVGKIHGTYNAHSKGCLGPLCSKYNRDKVRETYRKRNPLPQRTRAPRNPELDDLLTKVIAEHAKQVLHERATQTEREILASVS